MLAKDDLGLRVIREFEAPGFYEGQSHPASHTLIQVSKELLPEEARQLDSYAASQALLLKQDAFAWTSPAA